jgi:hypothetical protein
MPAIPQTSSVNFDGGLQLPSDRQQSQPQKTLQPLPTQSELTQPLQQQQLQQQQQQQQALETSVPIRDSIALHSLDSIEVKQATSVSISSSANPPLSPSLVSTRRWSPEFQPTADTKAQSEPRSFLELPSQKDKISRRSVSGNDTAPSSQPLLPSSSTSNAEGVSVSELASKDEKGTETESRLEKIESPDSANARIINTEPSKLPTKATINEPEFDEYMENITKRAQKLNEEMSKPSTPSMDQPESLSNLGVRQDTALSESKMHQKSSETSSPQAVDLSESTMAQLGPDQAHINDHNASSSGHHNHHRRQASHNAESSYYDNDSFDEDIYGYYADSDNNDTKEEEEEEEKEEDLFKSSLDHVQATSYNSSPPATESVAASGDEARQIKSSIVSSLPTNSSVGPLKDNPSISHDSSTTSTDFSSLSFKAESPFPQQNSLPFDPISKSDNSISPAEPSFSSHSPLKPPLPTSNYEDSDNESIKKTETPSYGRWKPIEPINSVESKPNELLPPESSLDESKVVESKASESHSIEAMPFKAPTDSRVSQLESVTGKESLEMARPRPPIPTSSYASDSDTDLALKTATASYGKSQPASKISENHSADTFGSSLLETTNSQQTNRAVPSINVQAVSQDDRSSDTPTTQSDLEQDIMKSFESSGRNIPAPIIAPSNKEEASSRSEYSLPNSPAVPDPEIAALYRDNSHFLTRPLSQLVDDFPATQPLSPQKSRDLNTVRSLDGVLEGDVEKEEEDFQDSKLKRIDSNSSWETQLDVLSTSKPVNVEEISEGIVNPKNPSRTPALERIASCSSLSDLSPVTSQTMSTNNDKSSKYMSMILNDNDSASTPSHELYMKNKELEQYDYLNRHGTLATTIINPLGSTANETTATIVPVRSVPDKFNRPPEFDFRAILTKPHSEDRKKAFEQARHTQAEYNSGLETWLEQVSAQMDPATLKSLGVVTTPTPGLHAKPVVPIQKSSTIFSTSSLKPKGSLKPSVLKQGIAGKLSISKVGEKSSGAASRLFAKGRKFMKSDK